MSYTVVIPARYGATRLPGKPLREVGGRTLVEHACRRAIESGAGEVIVATDDERIAGVARGTGVRVCMTDPAHPSGTDRIAEVARSAGFDDDRIVVNLQCDEPWMPAALIDQVADEAAGDPEASIATLMTPIEEAGELFDPNVVKVCIDARGYALYFSRAPIPWAREAFGREERALAPGIVHHRHIGLYAYRAGFLRDFVAFGPCELERVEALEQLRALWHGRKVRVARARAHPGDGIDTEADLERARDGV